MSVEVDENSMQKHKSRMCTYTQERAQILFHDGILKAIIVSYLQSLVH